MPKRRVDGVIEAVHYNQFGLVDWVRVYLRRGATFTDRKIIRRGELIESIKSGKFFFTGSRIPLVASTFNIDEPVHVSRFEGNESLVTGNAITAKDRLDRVPII